jgi:DNA-binding transcriptional ArsR family regulator
MRRDVFQAIADPTRRAILLLLAVQAMTPNALAENLTAAVKPYPSIYAY